MCAREMKQFMRDPQSSRSVLSDLIYGLGERRMVRQARISEAFLIYATRAGGQILEYGLGFSASGRRGSATYRLQRLVATASLSRRRASLRRAAERLRRV